VLSRFSQGSLALRSKRDRDVALLGSCPPSHVGSHSPRLLSTIQLHAQLRLVPGTSAAKPHSYTVHYLVIPGQPITYPTCFPLYTQSSLEMFHYSHQCDLDLAISPNQTRGAVTSDFVISSSIPESGNSFETAGSCVLDPLRKWLSHQRWKASRGMHLYTAIYKVENHGLH
jgi:hypothetical protein